MRRVAYYLLDVFTDQKYGGNQLAIFPDARAIDPGLFQVIASELNLSETVFLFPKNERGAYPMRIFTPVIELPTAGHPSIGAAFLLARESLSEQAEPLEVILDQKIGPIKVIVEQRHNVPTLATMFQVMPTFGNIITDRQAIVEILGLTEVDLLPFPIQVVSCGVPYLIIALKSIAAVSNIQINTERWRKHSALFSDCFVYAFTPHGERPGSDLHGRMFAPEAGITEDPATGSANGPLACYCLEYGIKAGPIVSEQGFEMGRPSILHIEAKKSDGRFSEVTVAGKSVFVGKGEFFLD